MLACPFWSAWHVRDTHQSKRTRPLTGKTGKRDKEKPFFARCREEAFSSTLAFARFALQENPFFPLCGGAVRCHSHTQAAQLPTCQTVTKLLASLQDYFPRFPAAFRTHTLLAPLFVSTKPTTSPSIFHLISSCLISSSYPHHFITWSASQIAASSPHHNNICIQSSHNPLRRFGLALHRPLRLLSKRTSLPPRPSVSSHTLRRLLHAVPSAQTVSRSPLPRTVNSLRPLCHRYRPRSSFPLATRRSGIESATIHSPVIASHTTD